MSAALRRPSDASGAEATLAALRDLRDATERALDALEREDATGACDAVACGERASLRLKEALARLDRPPAHAAQEARAIVALEVLALARAERAKARIDEERRALAAGSSGLRGYRGSASDAPPHVDVKS